MSHDGMHIAGRGLSENIYLHHKKKTFIYFIRFTSRASEDRGRPMVPSQEKAYLIKTADGGWEGANRAEIFRL